MKSLFLRVSPRACQKRSVMLKGRPPISQDCSVVCAFAGWSEMTETTVFSLFLTVGITDWPGNVWFANDPSRPGSWVDNRWTSQLSLGGNKHDRFDVLHVSV